MPLPRLSMRLRAAMFVMCAAAALAAGAVLAASPSEAAHLAAVPIFAAYALLFRRDILRAIRIRHVLYFVALSVAVAAYMAGLARVSTMVKVRWSELPLAIYFLLAVHVIVWLIDRLINAGLSAAFLLKSGAGQPRGRYLAKSVLRVALFAAVVTPYLSATFMTHWVKFGDGVLPSQYMGATFERVAFDATDGVRVEGWFIPSLDGITDATVVLVGGRGLSKSCFLAYAQMLRNNDLNVLLLDLRGEGGSEGHTRSFGVKESRDVRGAVRYLKQCKPGASRHVFGFGVASGAVAVLGAAAEEPAIEAVVVDSAFARAESALDGPLPLPEPLSRVLRQATLAFASAGLGCNLFSAGPVRDIARIGPRPVLLIQGQADTTCPPAAAEELLAAAAGPARLLRVPGAGHGQAMLYGGSEYTAQVLGVFKAVRSGRPAFADRG